MKEKWKQIFGLKTRLKNCWNTTKTLYTDFSDHSTIHGVNYLAEKDRSWCEKIWWILVFCVSVFCCAKLISDAWNINPIIISFTDRPTPIWEIPFPAVTICPNIYVKARYFSLSEMMWGFAYHPYYYRQLSEKKVQQLIALNIFCKVRDEFLNIQYLNCTNCLEALNDIRIPFDEMFVECKFRNKVINCSTVFEEVVLSNSICYTFNGLEVYRQANSSGNLSKMWSIEDGYVSHAALDAYPRRAVGVGTHFGLSVLLRMNREDVDYTCTDNPGFKIEYRMPYETPLLESSYFDLRLQHSLTSVVMPKMTTTSENLRSYPVSDRKCYFSNERQLKYFNQYTQSNCDTECFADFILKRCKCLPVQIRNRPNESICASQDCIKYFMYVIHSKNSRPCDCLPSCSKLFFETETTALSLNISAYSKRYPTFENFEYSQLTVYFKENQFITSQRSELYGQTDFLANCGGFLGLFLGVSILSFVEILYFCTVRLYFYIKDSNAKKNVCGTKTFVEPFPQVQAGSKGRLKIVKKLIADYTTRTTIQGINYVTDQDRSWLERVWWMIALLLAVFCCGSLISNVFDRYDKSPIIVSYDNEEMLATEIPFPAVTICPQIVSSEVINMYNMLIIQNKSLYELSPTEIEIVTALSQVCQPDIFQNVDPERRTHCEYCSAYLKYFIGTIDYVLYKCEHFYSDLDCFRMFKDLYTEEGLCYTYNSLEFYRGQQEKIHRQFNWTLDDGYGVNEDNVSLNKFYPRPGSKFPLLVDMDVYNFMNDDICKGQTQGFKVFLHLPNEAPQTSKFYYFVPYQQSVQFSISPRVITASPELRDFELDKRQCYFSDERYLRFFKNYTQNNCELECVANLTISKCGCLRFHMPQLQDIKYCGISDIACYQTVLRMSSEQTFRQSLTPECNCLPTCNSITYDAEINQVYWSNWSVHSSFLEQEFIENISFAKLTIVLKENQYIVSKRSQLFGMTELIANCGGLLGLFLGISFVSILEIVYFCTIRLFFSVKNVK